MKIIYPDRKYDRIIDITATDFKEFGIRAFAVDMDNTAVHDHTSEPLDGVADWIKVMQDEGFKILLMSNGKKDRAQEVAGKLGIDYVAMACKPLAVGYIKAAVKFRQSPKRIAMIGDQLFTDTLGANLCGWFSVYVCPAEKEKRSKKSFKTRRRLEKKIFDLHEGREKE